MIITPPPLDFNLDLSALNPQRQLDELDRVDCEESLYSFLVNAWRYIDASPWVDGWPIEAIAEHLQAVVDGEIKRLIINVPPRSGKSSVLSVAFPAWTWAQQQISPTSGPGVQFLMASYANQLVLRDSVKCRRLIESPWYQKHWGDRFELNSDQNTKSRFSNDKGGERLITSVGAAVTGEGGSVICADDPNSAAEAFSEANIEATIQWWDGTMSTRLNDQKTGAFIVQQQRLAENDLTGHILEKEVDGWTHLCLPMRFEKDRSFKSSIGWEDPRTIEGELLWPERFGEAEVKSLEKSLGTFMAAGQLQQRPEPQGGGIIKREWWQLWDRDAFPAMDFIIASLDTAYTIKTVNDYSALTLWGVFTQDDVAIANRTIDAAGNPVYIDRAYNEGAPKLMLMYAWQERLEFHDLVKKVVKSCTMPYMGAHLLLIENKAAGISLAQEIRRLYSHEKFGVQLSDPKSMDKMARLFSVQHIFEEGMVYAPDKPWAEQVITQVGQFPKGRHDDLCFVAGTMIATDRGDVPVESIKVGDKVVTPLGFRPVLAATCTGERPVVQRGNLIGTANHPVFSIDTGWQALDSVTVSTKLSRISLCDLIRIALPKQSSLMASPIGLWAESENTISRSASIARTEKARRDCTSRSGKTTTARRCRPGTMSTIATATRLIVVLKTWNAYRWACIGACLKTLILSSNAHLWSTPGPLPAIGTGLKRAVRGIAKKLRRVSEKPEQLFRPWALNPALPAGGAGDLLCEKTIADNGAESLALTRTLDGGGGCLKPFTLTLQPVFNLTVEEAHCYYANGILVHNCDTVSQSVRHLRNNGFLTRSAERMEEINDAFTYPGGQIVPLYPA